MKLERKIKGVIEAPLEDKGYDLVRVNIVGGKKGLIVGVDIDRLDGKYVTVNDCVEANRLISTVLDVEDFINGAYTLEVSSPGENRPLAKIRDFKRFCGHVAKMELVSPIDEVEKLTGKIIGVDESKNLILVEILEGVSRKVSLSINDVKRANVKRKF